MKERPIIFSGPMVRAILEGRKTQTRRVVVPQPVLAPEEVEPGDLTFAGRELVRIRESRGRNMRAAGLLNSHPYPCPYGTVGDRLWVRETWITLNKSGHVVNHKQWRKDDGDVLAYRASWNAPDICGCFKWRPSIHMPRWASRITLEVTGEGVERVQDIDDKYNLDAWHEGVCYLCDSDGILYHETETDPEERCGGEGGMGCISSQHPIGLFRDYWDKLNAKRGYGWDKNPYVWVIKFKRLEGSDAHDHSS